MEAWRKEYNERTTSCRPEPNPSEYVSRARLLESHKRRVRECGKSRSPHDSQRGRTSFGEEVPVEPRSLADQLAEGGHGLQLEEGVLRSVYFQSRLPIQVPHWSGVSMYSPSSQTESSTGSRAAPK